jgi:hypothetical protein
MKSAKPPKKTAPRAGHVLYGALTPREARLLAGKPAPRKRARPRRAR